MMYNQGIVAVVKCNGKILREDKDLVFLKFGSEYSILIKNLYTRKAKIKISIDGTDVLNGSSLILLPNTESELKGFLNGNTVKNKFKFIEKTQEISDYRGDKIDDGIIRIEYWFEKQYNYNYQPPSFLYMNSIGSSLNQSKPKNYGTRSIDFNDVNNCIFGSSVSCYTNNVSDNTDGITVKGSEVRQDFNYGYIGTLESESKVIILKLIGYKKSGKPVEEPITVKTKKVCPTCGKKSKSYAKFCNNCGTFLE